MLLHFYKFVGAGHDFILIDNRAGKIHLEKDTIACLCDKRVGVGAYGLIMLDSVSVKDKEADYGLRVFASDGRERIGLVNAARCCARFISALKEDMNAPIFLRTQVGVIKAEGKEEGTKILVTVPAPRDYSFKVIHTHGPLQKQLCFFEPRSKCLCMQVADVAAINVCKLASEILEEEAYREAGTTINFMQVMDSEKLFMRSYDVFLRAEAPTSGDAVLSAAIATMRSESWRGVISVFMAEEESLVVTIEQNRESSTLCSLSILGGADYIFEGDIEIPEEYET